MKTKRKTLVITRHGKTPINPENNMSMDNLLDESVQSIHRNTGDSLRDFVVEYDVRPEDSFVKHSGKKRTVYTAKAILSGAFGLQFPQSEADLDRLNLRDINFSEDPMLSYEGIKSNTDKFFKDMSGYTNRWFADPDATQYDGVEITSFNDLIKTRKNTLVDALGYMINGDKDLGILSTHGTIAEPLVMAAINSGRFGAPVTSFDQIGGQFDKEDYATITLDHNPRSDSYLARIERDSLAYRVDVRKLIDTIE